MESSLDSILSSAARSNSPFASSLVSEDFLCENNRGNINKATAPFCTNSRRRSFMDRLRKLNTDNETKSKEKLLMRNVKEMLRQGYSLREVKKVTSQLLGDVEEDFSPGSSSANMNISMSGDNDMDIDEGSSKQQRVSTTTTIRGRRQSLTSTVASTWNFPRERARRANSAELLPYANNSEPTAPIFMNQNVGMMRPEDQINRNLVQTINPQQRETGANINLFCVQPADAQMDQPNFPVEYQPDLKRNLSSALDSNFLFNGSLGNSSDIISQNSKRSRTHYS